MSQTILLSGIDFDAGTQIRSAISEAVVAEYAERMAEGTAFPMVVLFHDGTRYYMADGFHRSLASQRNGATSIAADVRLGTKDDALWFALGANRANGHRLTPADKKHAIVLALQTWPDRSQTQISEQVGCALSYVTKLRAQVFTSEDLPDRVTGKDGKSYPASRRTRAEIQAKYQRAIEMASNGYTSKQISTALGFSNPTVCRTELKKRGIDIPADRITRGNQPNSTRIVEHIVMDAENLTADTDLIDFARLDPARLSVWVKSLRVAQASLVSFIRRLTEEQRKYEAA